MKKVLIFSLLLVAGLIVGQFLPPDLATPIRLLTMTALAFIMIHVGYEFEIDKSRPRQYAWDYAVAFTAAAFPWVFCAVYFVFVLAPPELWSHLDLWKESLLTARFASPTSAGVLFSMLAAAGLASTWVFKKARILAIFDDLDTILLMIPLKMMMVGSRWQLWMVVVFIAAMLWMAWRYLHAVKLPVTWPFVMAYSVAIVGVSELIYISSKAVSTEVPIHLEVLLPAFVLGCMLARPKGSDPHTDDARLGHQEGPESPAEQKVSTIVAAVFMVLVGLSMPPILGADAAPPTDKIVVDGGEVVAPVAEPGAEAPAKNAEEPYLKYDGVDPQLLEQKNAFPGWGMLAVHVVIVTVISNLGKMFPAFCYRREAHWRERMAVAVGMWPRGEVGAGVLVISLSYGVTGPSVAVAAIALALNLLLTGVFILAVKWLIATAGSPPGGNGGSRPNDSTDDAPPPAHDAHGNSAGAHAPA